MQSRHGLVSTAAAACATALFLCGGVPPLLAQRPDGSTGSPAAIAPYALVGTVIDQAGDLVEAAEVAVIERDSTTRRTRTDAKGRFRFDSLTLPAVELRIRRLGFLPQSLTVRITKPGRSATVHVTLAPSVTNLDAVMVDDDAPPERMNPRLVAFNERAATNSFGRYVTEEMLAKMKPQFASDALRYVSGVVIRPNRIGRIGNLVRLRGCGVRGESFARPGPLIWLDGVRLPGAEIDEVTAGPDIAAIEVYNDFAGVPVQYFDRTAVCGTILVWTKSK